MIDVRGLYKSFEDKTVLSDISQRSFELLKGAVEPE